MTTLIDELQRHVKFAKQVVTTWEKSGPPRGSIEENLRMISEEVALLESMASAHPRRAKPILRLADRYRGVRSKLVA